MMHKTYQEIKQQYSALRMTFDHIADKKDELIDFWSQNTPKSLTYIGCGSGYCLCQSGEISAKLKLGIPANAFAAGDLLIHHQDYAGLLDGTMLVAPSRSGSTTEVIRSIQEIKKVLNLSVLAISCAEGSGLSNIADFVVELPWAYDESVCQTRSITNLYAANLLILAYLTGDKQRIDDIDRAIDAGNAYMLQYEKPLKALAEAEWSNAIILADGEMQGIACEAAMAFVEIAKVPAQYYHLLDVRHGPMALVQEDTLVTACLSGKNQGYERALIQDLVKRGAKVTVFSDEELDDLEGVFLNVWTGVEMDSAVRGIPFVFIPQILAYYKAERKGLNPDNPEGLVSWVKL